MNNLNIIRLQLTTSLLQWYLEQKGEDYIRTVCDQVIDGRLRVEPEYLVDALVELLDTENTEEKDMDMQEDQDMWDSQDPSL